MYLFRDESKGEGPVQCCSKKATKITKSILLKKENDIFLIYMEIPMGEIAKSYMKEKLNFPHIYGNSDGIRFKFIYEVMGKYLTEYDFAINPF